MSTKGTETRYDGTDITQRALKLTPVRVRVNRELTHPPDDAHPTAYDIGMLDRGVR